MSLSPSHQSNESTSKDEAFNITSTESTNETPLRSQKKRRILVRVSVGKLLSAHGHVVQRELSFSTEL